MSALYEGIYGFFDKNHFLSNFHPSPVTLDGELYPTVEHAYQAAKTFDPAERERIRTAPHPGQAKKLGRRVSLRADWDSAKIAVMLKLLRQKFADVDLRAKLMDTKDLYLEETNYWNDRYWGCCPQGNGKNMLGKMLMYIRDNEEL